MKSVWFVPMYCVCCPAATLRIAFTFSSVITKTKNSTKLSALGSNINPLRKFKVQAPSFFFPPITHHPSITRADAITISCSTTLDLLKKI